MMTDPTLTQDTLVSSVAKKFQNEGYTVLIKPDDKDMPFNLGTYHPDLIAKKSENDGRIIEIKDSFRRISVDHYREIAELVSQNSGWRFLLITGEDALQKDSNREEHLLSWEQIVTRKEQGERLLALGEYEGAFLALWATLEALLRKQAEQVSIPIERFPTTSLIKHLYSQGELSIEQFDHAIALLQVRNRSIHGFQTPELSNAMAQLLGLVNELCSLWVPEKNIAIAHPSINGHG